MTHLNRTPAADAANSVNTARHASAVPAHAVTPLSRVLGQALSHSRGLTLRQHSIRAAILAVLGGALSFTSAAQTYEFRQGIPALLVAPAGSPLAQTSTSAINFGSVATNTTAVRQVLLTNPGTAALTLTASPSVLGDASFDAGTTSCGATLGLGAQCVTEVLFSPTVVGEAGGSLRFSTSLAGLPAAVALAGTAYNPVVLAPTLLPEATLNAAYAPVNFASFLDVLNEQAPELGQVAWAAPSGLPAGMALSNSGVLSGTPTQATAGASFQVTATYKLNTGAQSYNWAAMVAAVPDPHSAYVTFFADFNQSLVAQVGGTGVIRNATYQPAGGYEQGGLVTIGTSAEVTYPATIGYSLPADFTVEGRFKMADFETYRYLFDMGATTGNGLLVNHTPGLGFRVFDPATGYLTSGAQGDASANNWFHVAVTRAGATVRLFINGTQVGSAGTTQATLGGGGTLTLGNYANSEQQPFGWAGAIDNFRVTKGFARYTSDFSVQAAFSAP